MRIADLLARAAESLQPVTDSPRLEAEVLLTHITGKDRAHFLAWPERMLEDSLIERFHSLCQRRCRGEPVAYLTGQREFWSRPFRVSPAVLIPRPETELLVETALSLCRVERPRILDLGTGSGALAITLALELAGSPVVAVDSSAAALACAAANAENLGASSLRLVRSDWFAELGGEGRFDLIVANPPYVASGDPHLEQGDLRFEPAAALVAGADGLQALRTIIARAPGFLAEDGWLAVEHGYRQGAAVAGLMEASGYRRIATRCDLLGNERVTFGCRAASFAGSGTAPAA